MPTRRRRMVLDRIVEKGELQLELEEGFPFPREGEGARFEGRYIFPVEIDPVTILREIGGMEGKMLAEVWSQKARRLHGVLNIPIYS